ncbi:helix-turn-helix transcriptional regulator [Spartinivicinus ruber]|uniref:helix-turn-helix transcriptional regulator n=1 Tax=Spartinivicinus ruber TaxID=2683272 RepID=UPI0013D73FDE|nr:helix-turn-helix domain-containing protein [Spartinivicinus ruber]
MKNFWQKVRAARVAAGLTQAQLAEKLGISRTSVIMWEQQEESKRSVPRKPTIQMVSQITGVPADWFLDDDAEFNPAWLKSNAEYSDEDLERIAKYERKEELLEAKESLMDLYDMATEGKMSKESAQLITLLSKILKKVE